MTMENEARETEFREPEAENIRLKGDICVHIFSVSAGMVGVCLTIIGIFQVGELQTIGSIADNVLAIDAVLFLSACLTSYIALRTPEPSRRDRIERIADRIFLLALSVMAGVCFIVTDELI